MGKNLEQLLFKSKNRSSAQSLKVTWITKLIVTGSDLLYLIAALNRRHMQRLNNALQLLYGLLTQFKVIISDSKGRSQTQELKDVAAQPFLGSKIGDSIDSSTVGITGGKIRITGGSDKSGTPMRPDIHGGVKKYVLLSKGVGMRDIKEGNRIRKLVRGNLITEEIYQLNCMLIDNNLPDISVNQDKPAKDDTKQ
jgi:small subunit ribosomal protein S6e